jgi:hypothetical protein
VGQEYVRHARVTLAALIPDTDGAEEHDHG